MILLAVSYYPDAYLAAGAVRRSQSEAEADMTAPLLELEAVTMQFGGLRCVSDFSLSVCENELIGLIGPNGAGKTTVFNLVTGVYRPTAGKISFAGKSVIGHRPYRITARGSRAHFKISGFSVH
jgi:ABC-type branched-subunit amino acid transport system ATPase component